MREAVAGRLSSEGAPGVVWAPRLSSTRGLCSQLGSLCATPVFPLQPGALHRQHLLRAPGHRVWRARHPAAVLHAQPHPRHPWQHCGRHGEPAVLLACLCCLQGCGLRRPRCRRETRGGGRGLGAARSTPFLCPLLFSFDLMCLSNSCSSPCRSAWPPSTRCSTARWAARSPARPRPLELQAACSADRLNRAVSSLEWAQRGSLPASEPS